MAFLKVCRVFFFVTEFYVWFFKLANIYHSIFGDFPDTCLQMSIGFVLGITSFFTVFYTFRNNSLHFICPPICSLFFGFPCHFAKVNLVLNVAFDHEHFHLSKPIYLVFTRSFQLQPVSCTV